MKKFLLICGMLLGMAAAEASTTVTIVVKDAVAANKGADDAYLDPTKNIQNLTSLVYQGFTFNVDKKDATTNPMYNKAGDYRIYGGSELTITAPEDDMLTRIVFAVSEDGLRRWPEITSDSGTTTSTVAAREVAWTGEAHSVTFTIGATADNGTQDDKPGIFQFDEVMLTVAGDLAFSSSPVISPESGRYSDKVEVTITAAEGAKIYYTTDGTTPTEGSTLYSGPFEVTRSCTVKAVAIEEGKSASNVVSADYVVMTGTDILNLRTFLEDNPYWTDSNVMDIYNFVGEYTVAYQNGRMLYIQDSTAGLLIGGRLDRTYQPGDVITGFRGTFRGVNGVPQLNPEVSSMGAPIRHEEYVWANGTYADVTNKDNMNRMYVLHNVDFTIDTATEGRFYGNLEFEGGQSCLLYNGFSSASEFNPTVTLPANGKYDVYGVVSGAMKETNELEMQFVPVRFAEATEVEPDDPGTGAVDSVEAAEVLRSEYFDMSGRRVSGDYKGIVVKKDVLANGKTRYNKEIRK